MHAELVARRSGITQASGDEVSNSWNKVPVQLVARGNGVIEDGIERYGNIFFTIYCSIFNVFRFKSSCLAPQELQVELSVALGENND